MLPQRRAPLSTGPRSPKRAGSTSSQKRLVRQIVLDSRLPPVSVADLAVMLEIDLLLSRRKDFARRLQKALNAAAASALSSSRLHFRS